LVTLAPVAADFYELAPTIRRIALNLTSTPNGLIAGVRENLRRIGALRAVLKQEDPDFAIAMMSTSNVLLALATKGLPRIRAIGVEHTYPPQMPLGLPWEILRYAAYSQLAAVVSLTHECAYWLRKKTTASMVPIIPNAAVWPLADQIPSVDPDTVCRPGRKLLLGVGRLSDEKNFDKLIEVFERLATHHEEWDLAVLGEGSERSALEARIKGAGLAGRIFLPGRIGNVGRWYERADLYVMTSRFEGFPNTLVEAMAYGLPAISFDCDTGPRDIIRHGIDGLLVPPNDLDSLQAALKRLMSDGDLRKAYGMRAIETRQRFSIEKIAAMWQSLFDECTRSRARPGVAEAMRKELVKGTTNEHKST
jgi:glycosyltransferase involved in cell wall biosynthesis